jgi:tetratricopeptide (TPR) repeat protein
VGQRWLRLGLWASLLAFAASLGFQKILCFDYWFHLRTGRLIAETGAVPRVDPYTYTVPGARWIDVHWLYQLGLDALHRLGGHEAVVVGKVVLVCAIVSLLATIGWRRERPWVTALVLGLMLLVAADRFLPRPELLSFLLLAAVLALLERDERRGDAWLWAIVPIQLVWANVHGLFALGLAVCAIYGASELVRPLLVPGAALRPRRIGRLGLVLLLGAAVSVLNPNGLEGALYPVAQLGMIGPAEERGFFGSVIAELIPPLPADRLPELPSVLLAGLLAALSLAGVLANWRRAPGAHPLLWVAFLYLALGAQRNLALFALVAAPIAVSNWNELLDRVALPRRVHALAGAVVAVALAALALDAARGDLAIRMGSPREAGLGIYDVYYPVETAEWIAREKPPGPICHDMANGGYLIWRLWPDYPVMFDGRLEVFGAERFSELMAVDVDRFRALDAEYQFGSVLIHYSFVPSEGLFYWLYLNPNWRLVHVDEVAALFVRSGGGRLRWPEVDVDDPGLFPPLGGDSEARDVFRRFARTNFYMSLRRYEIALRLWEETLERHPDLEQGPLIHALLLLRNGFPAAAEAILQRLLAERPDDPELLTQVAELRLGSGDAEGARALYDRALEVDPVFAYAALRRGMLAESQGDLERAALLYTRVVARTRRIDPVAVLAASRLSQLAR